MRLSTVGTKVSRSIKQIKKYRKPEIYDNAVSVRSPLGFSLSLSHTHIGLP